MKTLFTLFFAVICSISLSAQNYTGTWYSSNIKPVTLILTEANTFKVVVEDSFGGLLFDYGIFQIKENTFYEQFFDGTEYNYDIKNHTNSSFDLYYEPDHTTYHFTYNGEPVLTEGDQTKILSEICFAKLTGTWQSEEEALKFMGDGLLFYNASGESSQCAIYTVLGRTLRLQHLDATDGHYFFTARIDNFSQGRLVLSFESEREALSYSYQGHPKLEASETILHNTWIGINHRTSMNIIDGMDGVTDFIWKKIDDQ